MAISERGSEDPRYEAYVAPGFDPDDYFFFGL